MGASRGWIYPIASGAIVGTAHAVWTGIGAAGTVLAGILLFAEPASANRLMWIAVIVIGIVGLNLSST